MVERVRSNVGPDERARELLRLIVQSYIESGEPVGSRTLSRMIERSLSPATIRNIMADLEAEGYLSHPHTSAGRVPTELAYRVYVDSLGAARPTRSAEAYINDALARAESAEEFMSTACCLLSDLSQNVGIVISPPIEVSTLRHIEFIRVEDEKILVIFLSRTGLLQKKRIRVNEAYSQEELTRAGNYLTGKFAGRTLPEIRRLLLEMMQEERFLYDRMMHDLMRSWSDSLGAGEEPSGDSVYIHGTGNILGQVDPPDMARMQELFRLFEEKGRLVKILNECLGPRDSDQDRVQIAIGSELNSPVMRDFTVITSPYLLAGRGAAFVGIIGPTRMQYRKGISVVSYLAGVFSRRMSGQDVFPSAV
jgi:heat-inducible transcriptional repressor